MTQRHTSWMADIHSSIASSPSAENSRWYWMWLNLDSSVVKSSVGSSTTNLQSPRISHEEVDTADADGAMITHRYCFVFFTRASSSSMWPFSTLSVILPYHRN
jgi:hypothetical protein